MKNPGEVVERNMAGIIAMNPHLLGAHVEERYGVGHFLGTWDVLATRAKTWSRAIFSSTTMV